MPILVICDFGKNIFLHVHLKMSWLLMPQIVDLLEMVIVGCADCSFSCFIYSGHCTLVILFEVMSLWGSPHQPCTPVCCAAWMQSHAITNIFGGTWIRAWVIWKQWELNSASSHGSGTFCTLSIFSCRR